MQPLVASFVFPLIFIGALRNTYCGVLQSEVAVYEKNDVVLPCFTTLNMKVEWRIISRFQRTQIEEYYDSRRIYSTLGLIRSFISTGRYSVSEGNGFYNLTISNVNMSETGEYICHEDLAAGNRSSTKLTVLVNVSAIQNYETSSAFDGGPCLLLPCRVSPEDRVIWMYIKSFDAPQIVIFDGTVVDAMYASSFTVNSDQRTGYYNLTIDRVKLNLSGWFICMEYSRSIFIKTTRLTVLVNVSSFENPKRLWSTHGRDEILECHSTPFNPVRWFFIESQHAPQHVIYNGRLVEPEYEDKVTILVNEIGGDNELVLRNVQFNESGWYVCIDDGTSLHIHPYFLNVRVDIPSIRNREHMSVVNGSDANLPCRASNGGSIKWLFGESDISPQYVIYHGSSVEPQYSDRVRAHVDQCSGDFILSISNVQLNDSGWYICFEISSQLVHLILLKVHEASPVGGMAVLTVVSIITSVGCLCLFVGIIIGYMVFKRRRRSDVGAMKPQHIIEPDDRVVGVKPEDEVKRRVAGVTSIGNKLYVIRIPTDGKIEVYDKETYQPMAPLDIEALNLDDYDPWEQGFTSCTRRNSLYVSDKYKDKVYAVNPHASKGTQKCEILSIWDVKPHNKATSAGPSGLSIGHEGNVIVTCYEDHTIRMYEPDDTKGERPIIYRSAPTGWAIKKPYHAVELSDGRIAVSHYGPDEKKGVSLIRLVPDELKWEVMQNSTDCMPSISFLFPRYLTVNSKDYIFVVDQMNPGIIGLYFKGNISPNDSEKGTTRVSSRVFPVSIKDETEEVKTMEEPWCIYLDEGANRLYVGESKGRRVLMFDTSLMSVDDALK